MFEHELSKSSEGANIVPISSHAKVFFIAFSELKMDCLIKIAVGTAVKNLIVAMTDPAM